MHKPLILVGNLGRTLPIKPHDHPAIQNAAQAPAQPTVKDLSALTAQFALAGLELNSEAGLDGLLRLSTVWHGLVQPLGDLDHGRQFLLQIGGANA